MKRIRVFWLTALIVALVVGMGTGIKIYIDHNRRPPLPERLRNIPGKTDYEKELQEIALLISGYNGELTEVFKENDLWHVYLKFTAQPVNKAMDLIKKAGNVFAGLSDIKTHFAIMDITFYTDDLKDTYGHKLKGEPIIHIALSQETMEKINWPGFDDKNFPQVADVFWVHEKSAKSMTKEESAPSSTPQEKTMQNQNQSGSSQ
jgi:hypothetical protein